jgi:predicted  nucleic acid-binding Zn-ribbon protein
VKKSEQIAALKLECDRLAAERDAYRKALTLAHQQVRDLRAALARRDQTLGDRVRSEFHAKWDWLLEAVGL